MTEEAATDTAPVTTDTAPAGDAPSTQTPADTQTTTETPADTGDAAATDGTRAPVSDGTETPPDFTLPDEHKDKPWAAKVKSQEDLYKQVDNLTELIGKKTITPIDYETATPEEIAAHHSSLAPENISDYDFGEGGDPAFEEEVGGIFQKYGVDKYQAKGLGAEINELAAKKVGEQHAADTSEEGYFEIMKESFGDDYKEQVGIVDKALKQHAVSDDDKKVFDAMDNKTKGVVDRTVHSTVKFYEDRISAILKEHGVTETGAQADGGEGVNEGTNVDEVRAGLRNDLSEIDKRPHTTEEKQRLKDKLDATYR